MKNIINALNSENHSRIAKGLKKSLNKMGYSVSQTQASEAVSNTFGFPDLHSAQKHYAKNELEQKEELKNFIISFDVKIEDETGTIAQNIRKTQIFFDQKIVCFNMYALSKTIDFFDLELDKKGNKEFDKFLELTVKYINEKLKEEYLELSVFNFLTNQDGGFNLDAIFENTDNIILFNKIFENNFKNIGFHIYDDFNRHTYHYENFHLKEVDQAQINFMIDNGIGNC